MVWQFWFDVGGTFTDCLARAPDGRTQHRKVLSSSAVQGRVAPASQGDRLVDAQRIEPPGFWTGYQLHLRDGRGQRWPGGVVRDSAAGWLVVTPSPQAPAVASSFAELAGWAYELVSPEEAPLLAIRLVLGLRLDQPIPPCRVRLGTTRGTNALLTRQGARTALVTTRGLGDLWHIGYQDRPDLFALEIRKAELLVERVAEVHERLAADGSVLVPLDLDHAEKTLRQLREEGIQALAICLMHSTVNPRHEQLLAALAQRLGFAEVSLSSQAAAVRKLVPRGDTCMLDAYLNPVLRRYVAAIAERLPGSDLRLMTSTGGLVRPASFTGKTDSLLSGPAGGVVALARLAQAAGLPRVIGLDMGGTSTDVARYDGRLEYPSESHKAGVRLAVPTLAIETVAAGGGSICRYDGIKLVVGPASAGADPGPACYGRGGPLTITDCNLLLGRLAVERFPPGRPDSPAAVGSRPAAGIPIASSAGRPSVRRDRPRCRPCQDAAGPKRSRAARSGGRLCADRELADGAGHPRHLDPPGLRHARLYAGGLRLGRTAACLCRGGRAGHAARADPGAGRRAQRAGDRSGRGATAEDGRGVRGVGCCGAGSGRASAGSACRAGPQRPDGRRRRRRRDAAGGMPGTAVRGDRSSPEHSSA